MDNKKPKIITIASIKGGVGKSMLSIIFSYILSEMNNKVLIVDLDPQNSLTSYFLQYIRNIELNNVYYLLKRDQNIAFNEYIIQ